MSEEEKKVIETVEGFIKYYKKNEQTGNRANLDVLKEEINSIEFILNKYDTQQKELNSLKEIEQLHQEENGLLRQELDMQIEHNKELEATLKQTQDSWFEDTQKLEQEKEKNNNLIKQLQEQNTEIQDISRQLRQEKEKTPESVRKQFETYQNRICELEEKNKELEEKLKIATAMLTKGTYPEKNKGDNDFNKQFIAVDKIKEKIEETNNEKLNYSEDEYYLENEVKGYTIDKLKELLEEK